MIPNLGARQIADRETNSYAQPMLKRLGAIIGRDAPSAHQVQTRLRKLAIKMLVMRDQASKAYVMEVDPLASWVRAIE